MSVYPSVTKSVFRSVHKSLKVPPAVAGSSGGGGAFDPDLSSIQSRILDGGTIWTDQISSKYYLKDQSTDNTHLPRQGRCYTFDGVNDYGDFSARLTSGALGQLTASAWINTSNAGSMTIHGEYNTTGSNRQWLMCITDTPGFGTANKLTVWLSADGGPGNFKAYSSTSSVNTGSWVHVAFTFNSGTLILYVNGVAESTTKHLDGTVNSIFNGSASYNLGAMSAGSAFRLTGKLHDVRVYNVAKSAGEITAIYNQSRTGSGTFDSTGLLAAYPCNEESGTVGYDISGNSRHLTLTNITQATFHAADTGVLANRNNAEGYRLSGSVYIPKRLSDSLAADGNALTVTGRAAYHGCAEVPCVTGNGSNVYADLGSVLIPATADFELSFWYYHSGTSRSWIINQWASGQAGRISILANSQNGVTSPGYVDFAIDSTTVTSASALLTANTWNYFTITRVGSSLTCTFTPAGGSLVTLTSLTFAGSLYTGANTKFLDASFSLPNPSRISNFRITTGGVTTYFPLQDGPGSSNTNRNLAYVKSDGTGGVISNAIVNGTVSTIWGNRVPGHVKDWCIDNGGRIGAAGEYIAGKLGSGAGEAADDNTNTLVAGKHGNPFSRINLNPATAAEYNGKNIQTSYEDVPCITGNALNVYASLGDFRIPIGDHSISFWYYHNESNATVRRLFDVRVGSIAYIVVVNNGVADRLDFYGKSSGNTTIPSALVVNQWHLISLVQSGSTITCTVTKQDGTTTSNSTTATGEVTTSPIYLLGGWNNSGTPAVANPSGGRISDFRLTASGVTTYFPLSDGSGADLAWYKSDGTKGVISSALQGTLTNVWANKTDGSKVPAIKYSLRAIVTRESKFNRVASSGDDRFLIYESALSGSDLTNVETYVS